MWLSDKKSSDHALCYSCLRFIIYRAPCDPPEPKFEISAAIGYGDVAVRVFVRSFPYAVSAGTYNDSTLMSNTSGLMEWSGRGQEWPLT